MCLAVPGRLVAQEACEGLTMGKVDFGGVRKEVCLEGAPEARIGDWVLVHAGFVLRVLDTASAEATLAFWDAAPPASSPGGNGPA